MTKSLASHQHEQVAQLCRRAIDALDAAGAVAIDAKDVARKVARSIDRKKKSPPLLFVMSIDGIAQVARPILRNRHGTPDDETEQRQVDAFARRLQKRYAIKRAEWGNTSKYVLRDDTDPQEIDAQVIPMLTNRRDAYDRHLDLLREWNERRK